MHNAIMRKCLSIDPLFELAQIDGLETNHLNSFAFNFNFRLKPEQNEETDTQTIARQ